MNPARRSFIVSTATASVAAGGVAGCAKATENDRQLSFASLAAAEDELARLAQAKALVTNATWNWAQTLAHCAQSIEYSITGFPESKSALFQRTLGAAAIGLFGWRGRMTHDLAEPIPCAPRIEAATDPALALERLRTSIRRFRETTAPLRPHFAYGELDKPAYELAHAMHLANHISGFRAKTSV